MGDTPDAFTMVRIMGPATQAKSPASGRGDEESMSEAESQMSVSLHSVGDPQSPFSGLACILSLYNRGPYHHQREQSSNGTSPKTHSLFCYPEGRLGALQRGRPWRAEWPLRT